MKVRTQYNYQNHLPERTFLADFQLTSQCIQVDTSIKNLINDPNSLENTKDNGAIYTNSDDIVNLFQPAMVDRKLDPVEVHFYTKQANLATPQNPVTAVTDASSDAAAAATAE